jgi:hypothetical protein
VRTVNSFVLTCILTELAVSGKGFGVSSSFGVHIVKWFWLFVIAFVDDTLFIFIKKIFNFLAFLAFFSMFVKNY